MHSDKKFFLLYPLTGIMAFALLSFAHDGFRMDRGIETYYLPIAVGAGMGCIIAYFRNKIEARTRMYERKLSKEREDAAMGRAAAAIAHEVRNPLNALAMGLQRLQMEAGELGSEHRQLLDLMLSSVRRANGIIGNLLRYSKPQRPEMESFSLDGLLDGLLILYKPCCDDSGIAVRKHVFFHEPVFGDPNLIRQVIENLLANAIEAQPGGGFLETELKDLGREVVLAVRNGGFAIPPGEAERIFDPYFTTKATGTGLGVSIAHRIVEAHGGRMEVDAAGDGQVEIRVYLPSMRTRATIPDGTEGSIDHEDSRC